MAINLHCTQCKSDSTLRSKKCKKCGHDFSKGKKYRVIVKAHDGKRVTKTVGSISVARKFEGKLKAQAAQRQLFGISKVRTIDWIWDRYLDWAKGNKKSWPDDRARWGIHIRPHVAGKKMDSVLHG